MFLSFPVAKLYFPSILFIFEYTCSKINVRSSCFNFYLYFAATKRINIENWISFPVTCEWWIFLASRATEERKWGEETESKLIVRELSSTQNFWYNEIRRSFLHWNEVRIFFSLRMMTINKIFLFLYVCSPIIDAIEKTICVKYTAFTLNIILQLESIITRI